MSASGVSVDPEKVKAVMSWERSETVFEIRSFLGLEMVLQEVDLGFLLSNNTYDKVDPEGGQVRVE